MKENDLLHELEEAKAGLIQVMETVRQMKCEYDLMASDLHDCLNELCLHCGKYHEEHLGACDSCRWLKPRRGW